MDNDKRPNVAHSIRRSLLVPLLAVVVLVAVVPIALLAVSNTGEQMEQSVIGLDSRTTENHADVLQSAMVDQWASIRGDVSYYEEALANQLAQSGQTVDAFLADSRAQRAYVSSVYEDLLDVIEGNTTSGIFLVMANADGTGSASRHTGVYVRDSDPTMRTQTNSDLLIERGDQAFGQDFGLALDNSWNPTFDLGAAGARAADDFYYEPLKAGNANPDVDASALGYWSAPFILEDSFMDGHRMISYSVPLRANGKVFAVLGIEVSVDYLAKSYLSTAELSGGSSAGFALAYDNGDGTYTCVTGNGVLYNYVGDDAGDFALEDAGRGRLFRVRGVNMGKQDVYAVKSDISLYDKRVPYEHSKWVLVGLVSEDSIFSASRGLFRNILLVSGAALAVGIAVIALAVRGITRPVHRLMESVRGGSEGLAAFQPSRVAEINELHDIVDDLSAKEGAAAERLSEEKERYRQAIESTSDIFYTLRPTTHEIEIVNSLDSDGIWNLDEWGTKKASGCFSPDEMPLLGKLRPEPGCRTSVVLRGSIPGYHQNGWIQVNVRSIVGVDGATEVYVGYLHDITEEREREIAEAYAQVCDPVSGFYKRDAGLNVVWDSREELPQGTLVLIDLDDFFGVVSNYGLIFGDVLICELAHILRDAFGWQEGGNRVVLIRAGGDEFLIWAGGMDEQECASRVQQVRTRYAALVRKEVLDLGFCAGIVGAAFVDTTEELSARARVTAREAKLRGLDLLAWENVEDPDAEPGKYGEVVSTSNVEKMSLPSIAMNLLDRRFSMAAALDLLSNLLQERFGLQNLMVTNFSMDNLAITMAYQWQGIQNYHGKVTVLRCSATDAERLQEGAERGALVAIKDFPPIGGFKSWSSGQSVDGVTFFMTDNAHYSGSITYKGIDSAAALASDEEATTLREISIVIQNRINQERLDQSARAKSDFLARMSHEIRTPMNGIIGMTEIALLPGQTEERRTDCLKKVRSSSHYLLDLLNDILDMSKIESGKMGLVAAEFDLAELVGDLRGVVGTRFDQKRQRLVFDVRLEHTRFIGDAMRVNQVLINLLGNANKYSGEDTDVVLTVSEVSEGPQVSALTFAVADHGVGVSPEDAQRIFEKFEQVDSADARQQGTGLGLAISNRLVHMMGGQIELESEVGRGSTFSFTIKLPVAAEGAGAEPGANGAEPGAGAEDAGAADLRGLSVLVAEDNELNMEILTYLLEDQGCVVEGVPNGLECVSRFKESEPGRYGLILMDVMMPVMDGLTAARQIRALDRADAATVPIVAASANAFEEDVKRSIGAGMNAHISKPIEISALLAALANVL
ncbi:ATP-binding protein [Paratractidigestivibacter sp.]|uniref:ATP-binding protein n=1 Tax=Paratractidigestivibacter sp. TaxID=2847316 RepID=UPI002AC9C65E|nr:ATP-binding protein [Paratractidigestivibacter sp.]